MSQLSHRILAFASYYQSSLLHTSLPAFCYIVFSIPTPTILPKCPETRYLLQDDSSIVHGDSCPPQIFHLFMCCILCYDRTLATIFRSPPCHLFLLVCIICFVYMDWRSGPVLPWLFTASYLIYMDYYLFCVHRLEMRPLAPLTRYHVLSCVHGFEVRPFALLTLYQGLFTTLYIITFTLLFPCLLFVSFT